MLTTIKPNRRVEMFVVIKKVWAHEKPGEQIGLSCAVSEAR